MGKLGVFGIYVTSAAADAISVPESYARDPMLPNLKEPSRAAALRAKSLLEAGFLTTQAQHDAKHVEILAKVLLQAIESENERAISAATGALFTACVSAWQATAT
jgi:hypothetical protein